MVIALLEDMLQERQALIIRKQYHCRDVISGQVNLHMTDSYDNHI